MTLPPCPCGKPWALETYLPETLVVVEDIVARHGEYVPVTIGSRTWLVPRRCIAYHGITSEQLTSGTSGFEEILDARRNDG